MNWISLILMLIRYGPSVFKTIKAIIGYIKKINKAEISFFAGADPESRLYDAIAEFKLTGNSDGLKRLESDLEKIAGDIRA